MMVPTDGICSGFFVLCLLNDLSGHASQHVGVTLALSTCSSMHQSQLQLTVPAIVILSFESSYMHLRYYK